MIGYVHDDMRGMSTLARSLDPLLVAAVEAGDVPCVVVTVADERGVLYEGSCGPRAVGAPDRVTPDTRFAIMSMTKAVTTVAALQLVEQGRIELDVPVDEYRPEFAALQVLDGFDGDEPRLRPPASRATVRQLLTSTCGLSYWFWNDDIRRWEAATGTPNVGSGSKAALTAPLVADPGTRWEYGTGTDWLGLIVETVSGSPLDVYVRDHVTGPLGMERTIFHVEAEQQAELAPVHMRGEDGAWFVVPPPASGPPEYWNGGNGLSSTPRDFLRFQQMLLGDGTLGRVTILQPATVEAAFTNQLGALELPETIRTAEPLLSLDVQLGRGAKWGLGLLLSGEHRIGVRAPGSGGWVGLGNTCFWVDRTSGLTVAIYTPSLPFGDPRTHALWTALERQIYAPTGGDR